MAFLNPLILLALPLAAIPFFLHLMRRRRAPKQEFTYLRFLREAHRQRFLSFQIQELLLLLLRTTLILLLILALAGPTLPTGGSGLFRNLLSLGTPGREILVVVDNSMSMSAAEDSGTRLEAAASLARDLARNARGTDRIQIISSQDLMQDSGAFPAAGDQIDTALETIQPGTGTWSALGLIEHAVNTLESPDMGLSVVLSDWQATPWQDFSATSIPRNSRAARAQNVFVDVGSDNPENVWFDQVRFPRVATLTGEPLNIQLRVRGVNLTEPQKVMISARDSQNEILDSRSIVLNLPLEATGTSFIDTSINLLPRPAEGSDSSETSRYAFGGTITLEFDPDESDEMPSDNQIRFHVPVIRRMNVLILAPESDSWSPFVLRLALETPPSEESVSPVTCATLAPSQIGSVDLKQYDAVLLAGPAPAGSPVAAALNAYVREGGGLFWILDPSSFPRLGGTGSTGTRAQSAPLPRMSRYLALLSLSGWLFHDEAQAQSMGSSLEELLGIIFEQEWISEEGQRITEVSWDHAVLADLADFGKGAFQNVRFWRGMEISNLDKPLLSMDYLLLLAEKSYGQGRVLLLTSNLGKTSSDLAVSSIFLPLIQQSVKYTAFGDSFGESAAGQATLLSHAPADESDLTRLSEEMRRSIEEISPVQFVKPDAALRLTSQGTAGRSLTSPLLALCILLSIMELAAANLRR